LVQNLLKLTHLTTANLTTQRKRRDAISAIRIFMRITLIVTLAENVDLVMFAGFVGLRKLQIISLVKRKLLRKSKINV
jgi:hypothetical protein